VVVENGVREIYSARYYNPQTGRFLSRDPEDGKATNPATLHKYLYAGGDPVNRVDRSGRDYIDYVLDVAWGVSTACKVVSYGWVLMELEMLKEYGHFIDIPMPVKLTFVCSIL
jgi:RHS repeat-associated protein